MPETGKAQWYQVEAIRDLDGVVEVQWKNPLYVLIHRDVRSDVRRVLAGEGYFGDVTFEEFPDDPEAIIDHQAQHLNNFDLLLIPSSRRPDLGDFGVTPSDEVRCLCDAVDLVMSEQGVTREQIQQLHDEKSLEDLDTDPAYRSILVPLFRALRMRGFKASTLRG